MGYEMCSTAQALQPLRCPWAAGAFPPGGVTFVTAGTSAQQEPQPAGAGVRLQAPGATGEESAVAELFLCLRIPLQTDSGARGKLPCWQSQRNMENNFPNCLNCYGFRRGRFTTAC